MIKLTPIEIERHEFKTVWRGYDPDEVRAFLAQIAQQLTALVREQEKAEESLALKAQRLVQVEDYETKLRDALLAASTLAEQTREEAKRDAELTIREAEVRADQILSDGRQALQSIMSETQSLKRQRERLNVELRSVIESHLRMLENQEENLKSSRARWRDEEEQWREMAGSLFNRGGEETLADSQGGDALLEARELTLALGNQISDEDEDPSIVRKARGMKRDETADMISPSLPEPLTKRPLVAKRFEAKDSKPPSYDSKTGALSSSSEPSSEQRSSGETSGEASGERSGLMKLQKVLSEVPRRSDEG